MLNVVLALVALLFQLNGFCARILDDFSQVKQIPLPHQSAPSPPLYPGTPPSNATCQAVADADKEDCGYSGINQQICEQNNSCCWVPVNPNPNNYPWCFYPPKTLHPTPPTTPHPTPRPTPPTVQPTVGPTTFECNLPSCQTYDYNQCDVTSPYVNTSEEFEAWRWFTPMKNMSGWIDTYQDYSNLVAYVDIKYVNTDMTEAYATIVATHKAGNSVSLTYYFNDKSSKNNSQLFTSKDTTGPVTVKVTASDNSEILLDPIDFKWNVEPLIDRQGDYRNGQKGAIVEMFGWPHKDIEMECAKLASDGYLGVKLFPPQEQVMSYQPFQNYMNPWYFMYQPVSYRLQGRMGTRDDVRNLITTCRGLGVRVYADAVINHMVGGGNDRNHNHRNDDGSCTTWGVKNSSLSLWEIDNMQGSSPFYTQDFAWTCSNVTGFPPSQEFPAAAYGPLDFHCERALNEWDDPTDLNAGWLSGLVDLNTERTYVQERIAAYLTDLISIGFSGFRVDAAKHIQPPDLVGIFTKLRNNLGGVMPDDFITWWEILLGGESDLLMCNASSGYNYGSALEELFLDAGWTQEDLNKVKIWNSGYPKEPELGYCTITPYRNAIQNDDADQQTSGSTSRDMGSDGCVLIETCSTTDEHRQFEITLFENPYGIVNNNSYDYPIRLILSSYYWPSNGGYDVPDGQSDCNLCTETCEGCLGMNYTQAYDASSTGYDAPVYTRPHRDSQIVAAMQSWMDISSNGNDNDNEYYVINENKINLDIFNDKGKAKENLKRWQLRQQEILHERKQRGLIP